MTNLTHQQMIAKYRMFDPPRADNANVDVILAAERLEAKAFTRGTEYNRWLFDPVRSPRMHAIAAKAHRELREAIAPGYIECPDPNDYPDPNDDSVLVHFVGSKEVHSVERGKSADRFAAYLRRHDATQPYCDDYECNVRIADDCEELGASTMLMPLLFGGVLLVFECCGRCHYKACELASDGYKLSVMAAHELATDAPLPTWAKVKRDSWWTRVRRGFRRDR